MNHLLGRRTALLGAFSMLATAAQAEDRVFLTYTQSELDRAYDQSAWAPTQPSIVARYASDSLAARRNYRPRTERYGQTEIESLDIFTPPNPGRVPIHVFLHGGAWLSLSKDDASAMAPSFVDSGAIYIAVNFDNLRNIRLPEMVEQCRHALRWIHANAASFGGDGERMHISGHSSGAHLAAVMLTTDWAALGQPADLLKSGLLMSGIYDLYPVSLSSRRRYVKLSPAEIVALSPMRHLDQLRCPVSTAFGDLESPEFKRQSTMMADALAGMGMLRSRNTLFNRNHFEVPEELNRSDSPLGRLALSMMGLA